MTSTLASKIMLIVAFAAFMVVGTLMSKRVKNSEDYYVMGHQAGTVMTTGTVIASYCSSAFFTGIFAISWNTGEGEGMLNYGCLITWMILMFVLGPRISRMKAFTIPEIMEKRFGSGRIRTLSSVLLILASAAYLVSMFVACGIAIGAPLGVSTKVAILISGIVVLVFAVSGGMWGVVVTDTMMMFLFLAAALIGFPIALTHAGVSSPGELIAVINQQFPGTFKATGYMPLTGAHWWSQSGFVGFIGAMAITSAGVGLTSSLTLSRTMICKSDKTVARSFMLAQIILIALGFLIHTTAPFIKIAAPADTAGSSGYIWMLTNWVPPVVTGIILAGISAAGLSTCSTLLQQAGSSFANDIVDKFFLKADGLPAEQRERKVLHISRITMLVVGVVMILVSMIDVAGDFFVLYAWAFASGIFMCWLPAILIGSVSKRVTEKAAFWSILISLVVYMVCWILTMVLPDFPHQIFITTPLCFIILFVLMARSKPGDHEIRGFWLMQSKKYKKDHGYTGTEA